MFCASCGTDQPPSSATCATCGAPAPRPCPRCRIPVIDEARFCPGCGEPLAAGGAPVAHDELRTVTVLFADVSGSTALSASLEPDDVKELMDRCFDVATRAIRAQGGTVDKYIGDCVMALFGAPLSHGDDAARAVRAALAVQRAVAELSRELTRERGFSLALRVGLHTGKVLAGLVGSRDFTVMGEAVAVAKRLESACPVASVLISAATYRQVRGLFDVWARDPVLVKGRREPVPVFEVLDEREGGALVELRGVEGIETPLVGRSGELARLVSALSAAVEAREARLLLVEGPAGIGKSRLAHAFRVELEDRPQPVARLEGRGVQYDASAPYGLLSRLVRTRAAIGPADPPAEAKAKLAQLFSERRRRRIDVEGAAADRRRRGPARPPAERRQGERRADEPAELEAEAELPLRPAEGRAEPARADGVEASELDAVARLLEIEPPGDPDALAAVRARGCQSLRRLLARLAGRDGLVLLVEDLHLGDEASLSFLGSLAGMRAPILVVGFARPELGEDHPGAWPGATRLRLSPLPEAAVRELCHHIFRLAPELPEPLERELVTRAAGNPFFLEELVKDLLERGVVRRDAGADGERWSIGAEAIASLGLPQSVEALLQARLDRLPQAERELLRRAAVLGRVFWDQALVALKAGEPGEVRATLAELAIKDQVRPRPTSRFPETREWIFTSALLRDVAYQSLPRKERAEAHRAAARFLEERGAAASYGLLPGLARHLELAGDAESARERYLAAADAAAAVFALREALALLGRALALDPPPEQRFALAERRVQVLERLGERAELPREVEALSALALQLPPGFQARALRQRGRLRVRMGDLEGAERNLADAERALLAAADPRRACLARVERAHLALERGEPAAAVALARAASELAREAGVAALAEGAAAVEGAALLARGDLGAASQALSRARDLAHAANLPDRELVARMNLALCQLSLGEAEGARAALEEVVDAARSLGLPAEEGYALANLADAARGAGDPHGAVESARAAEALGRRLGDARLLAAARVALALAYLARGGRSDSGHALTAARAAAQAPHPAQAAAARMAEARALLARGDAAGAARTAADAVAAADRLGGLEDHEPLARWTLVEALTALGRADEAHSAREKARERLAQLAARIGDPAARRAFLTRVPLHRAINEVAG